MIRLGLNRVIGKLRFICRFKESKEFSEISKKGKPSEKAV
jgi:hypothetical protein